MSNIEALEKAAAAKSRAVDMKLEIVVIPVSDVDRAKAFYADLGWRLDADFARSTSSASSSSRRRARGASVIFGKNVTAAAPSWRRGFT